MTTLVESGEWVLHNSDHMTNNQPNPTCPTHVPITFLHSLLVLLLLLHLFIILKEITPTLSYYTKNNSKQMTEASVGQHFTYQFMGFMHKTPHAMCSEAKGVRTVLMSPAVSKFRSQTPIRIRCQMVNHPLASTYSSRISTDIPLYETPGASFDQYLEDKPRVFKAMFPDKQRSQQLNEEEWRVHMLPLQFLFLTVSPVIDMRLRCKTDGKGYPPGIPPVIAKVLELDIVRWELQGLDDMAKPTHFSLGVQGALYPDRRGVRSRLKGQLEMKISVILPPMLTLVPEDILRSFSETVLRRLVENMKDRVNSSLLADYSKFRQERQMKPTQPVELKRDI